MFTTIIMLTLEKEKCHANKVGHDFHQCHNMKPKYKIISIHFFIIQELV